MDPSKRRESLLLAAKKVFADKGFHGASVGDIVAEAGVARGTFYLYFRNKRDVFSAVTDFIFQSLMERLEAIPLDPPERILRGILDNLDVMAHYFQEDSDQARTVMSEAMTLDAESVRRLNEMRRVLVEWLARLIRTFQAANILRDLDPDVVAEAFIGSVTELFERGMLGGHGEGTSRVLEHLIKLYLFGLTDPGWVDEALNHLKEIGVDE